MNTKNEDRLGPIDGTDRWDPVSYVPPSQVSKKTPLLGFFLGGAQAPLLRGAARRACGAVRRRDFLRLFFLVESKVFSFLLSFGKNRIPLGHVFPPKKTGKKTNFFVLRAEIENKTPPKKSQKSG